MKKLFIPLFLLLAWAFLMAQVTPPTYVHPKPYPISGTTSNYFTATTQPFGPSSYANENPVVWSIDLGGGLHSRSNAADRINLNKSHTQEGAIVYDASDKIYYGVDDTLTAQQPLFPWNLYNIVTNLQARKTIYTGDDALTGDRTVDLNQHTLRLTGPSGFSVNSGFIGLSGSTNFSYGTTNMVIGSKVRLDVQTPGHLTANSNDVLTLLDPTTGTVEFKPSLGITSPINIYTTNGTLTSDRTLTTGPRLLNFNATGGRFSVFNADFS